MRNPYEVLGVPNNTDIEQCRKVAKKLAIKYHPDNDGDTERFIAVQDALKRIEKGGVGVYTSVQRKSGTVTHKGIVDIVVV